MGALIVLYIHYLKEPMSRFSPLLRLGLSGMTVGLLLTGCALEKPASSTATPTPVETTSSAQGGGEHKVDIGTLIDVRTPSEFGEGHLEGAINMDLTSPDFSVMISKLDKNKLYTVYCRSGSRSGEAVKQMTDAGFTNVVDAGGYQDAAQSLGLPTVKDS